MRSTLPILSIGLLLLSGQALAQPKPPAACPATDANLPAEWSAWTNQIAVNAASEQAALGGAAVSVGRTAKARLSPQVIWVAPPEKSPAPGSKGGLLALNVSETGRYAVALGAAAWLDVVAGTTEQKTVGHGHGPDCSSIRKYVEYDLKPGRYVLQVSGNADADIGVLVVRRP